MTASVAVPRTYLEQVWRKENDQPGAVSRTPDADALAGVETRELEKVERLVGNLLPRDTSAGPQPRVVVSTFHSLVEPSTTTEQLRDQAQAWLLVHWQTVSLAGLAVVGLLVLRSMVRSVSGGTQLPSASAAMGLPAKLSLVSDDFEQEPDEPTEPFERHDASSASLSGELAEVVRNDPEAAVHVLRTWIGNAS